MSIELTHATFAKHLGETFVTSREGFPTLNLKLHEVTDLRHPERKIPAHLRQEPFQLTFLGPREPILPQSIYTLTNETFGEVELFVIHGGPEGEQQLYYVTVN